MQSAGQDSEGAELNTGIRIREHEPTVQELKVATPSLHSVSSEDARKRRFEEMVTGELDSLFRTAMTLTHKREDAEEVVQETLVKAWRSLDSFREGERPHGWLITILINVYRDRYRRQKQSPATIPLESDDTYMYAGAIEADRLGGADPEDAALTEEISDPVLKAIQSLPAAYREALLLVDLEGFTYREAAEILGTLTGTVMSRLHRARTRLRRTLSAYVAAEAEGRMPPQRKRPGPQAALAKTRTINCGEACRHLHAYIDGVLDAEDARKIDGHLDTCRRCCDRFEFERRQKALLVVHHVGTKVPRGLMRRLQGLIAQF